MKISIPGLVRVKTRTWTTDALVPPGIVPAAAYTSGDVIGSQFAFKLPFSSGVLQSAEYNDNDDEGLQVDLLVSRASLRVVIADNGAWSYSKVERDVEKQIGEALKFTVFEDFTNCQKSSIDNIGRAFDLQGGRTIYCLAIARGALNIAAGALPSFRLTFLGDY